MRLSSSHIDREPRLLGNAQEIGESPPFRQEDSGRFRVRLDQGERPRLALDRRCPWWRNIETIEGYRKLTAILATLTRVPRRACVAESNLHRVLALDQSKLEGIAASPLA